MHCPRITLYDVHVRRSLRRAVAAIVAALTVACAQRTEHVPSPVPSSTRTEDVAVYAAVLDSLFQSAAPNRLLVLGDSTDVYRRENLLAEFWSDLRGVGDIDRIAIIDFERRARTALSLRALGDSLRARLPMPIDFVSDSTLRSLPRTGTQPTGRLMSRADFFWQAFYARFPGAIGTVSLSPVGYSRNRRQAIVYVTRGCGSLCGEGRVVVLMRRSDSWHVVATRQTWVS